MERKDLLALNEEYLSWYNENLEGIPYTLKELQYFVNTVINWYEIKYPNYLVKDKKLRDIIEDEMSKLMTIEQLKKTLPDNVSNLLNISKDTNQLSNIATRTLNVIPYGLVNSRNPINSNNINGVKRAYQFISDIGEKYGYPVKTELVDFVNVKGKNDIDESLIVTAYCLMEDVAARASRIYKDNYESSKEKGPKEKRQKTRRLFHKVG